MTTTANTRRLVKLLDGVFQPMGLVKKGQKWERRSSETICRIGLQRSRSQYYLDFAVSVLQLSSDVRQSEPVWHIIGRMFSPSVQEKIEWEHCLNFSTGEVSGKPREARLLEILQDRIVPLLHSFETLDGIKRVLFSGQLRGMGIRSELQDLTGYRS